ncbi:unnamed protein product [Schistosoma curassoni]|nr:unnamed protein product [Schistosoma curassoni]
MMMDLSSPVKRHLMPLPQVEKIKLEIAEKDKDPQLQKFLSYSLESQRRQQVNLLNIKRAHAEYRRTQTKLATLPIPRESPFVPNFMVSEELKLTKNYNLMKSYVESSIIPEIQDDWLQNVLAKTPSKLKIGREYKLNEILIEVKEHFLESLRKSLTSQTLKRPNLSQFSEDKSIGKREFSSIISSHQSWHSDLVKYKKELVSQLIITHHHMQKILCLCHQEFSSMRLTNVLKYRELGAIDFGELRTLVQKEIDTKCEYLLHNWYPRILKLFSDKKSVPKLKTKNLEKFFNCVSTLLSIQIKQFLQRNLLEWVEIFDEDHKEYLPILKIFSDLEDLIFLITGLISNSLQNYIHETSDTNMMTIVLGFGFPNITEKNNKALLTIFIQMFSFRLCEFK